MIRKNDELSRFVQCKGTQEDLKAKEEEGLGDGRTSSPQLVGGLRKISWLYSIFTSSHKKFHTLITMDKSLIDLLAHVEIVDGLTSTSIDNAYSFTVTSIISSALL